MSSGNRAQSLSRYAMVYCVLKVYFALYELIEVPLQPLQNNACLSPCRVLSDVGNAGPSVAIDFMRSEYGKALIETVCP
jgi:hypothetical protein